MIQDFRLPSKVEVKKKKNRKLRNVKKALAEM